MGWFKNLFDMGGDAWKKELEDIHEPGHAEKHQPKLTKKAPRSFGTVTPIP